MGKERQHAERFSDRLREVYGDGLVSVVLYGSAARGDYREGISDLNVLVILRELDAEALRRGSVLARDWVAEGNPPPLMLSEGEWNASADVFPIEYSDIRDGHVVLAGADPFSRMTIEWRHLRLQCEHELKTNQIRLRERYLLCADQPEPLGQLLRESFPSFLTLFRTGLRLAGEAVSRDPAEVLQALGRRAEFDPEPFLAVHRARVSGEALAPAGDGPIATGYLAAVERTTRWLDRLREPAA